MNAPTLPAHEFHLALADALFAPAEGSGRTLAVVPAGITRLTWDASLTPALTAVKANDLHQGPLLEPLAARDGQPRLLLALAPHQDATVNGAPAPRLTLLAEGDRFHFDAGPLFRLDLFHQPQLGPVPPALIGVPCAVCSLALAEGTRCLVCSCSTPMHAAEDETQPGALACAQMVTHCPHCQQPVRLVPGYGEHSGREELSHPHE